MRGVTVDLNNMTMGEIVTLLGFLTVLGNGVGYLLSPVVKFKKRVEILEAQQKEYEKDMKGLRNDTNMILKTLRPILDHMSEDPNGNHTKELKEARETLNDYIIERK